MANDELFRHSEISLDADHQGELLVAIERYQQLLVEEFNSGNLDAHDYAVRMKYTGHEEARIAANIATLHDIEVVESWQRELNMYTFMGKED